MKKSVAWALVLSAVILGIAMFVISGTSIAQDQGGAPPAQGGGRGAGGGGRGAAGGGAGRGAAAGGGGRGAAAGGGGRGAAGGGRAPIYVLNDPAPQDPALIGAFDLHSHLDPDSNGPSYGQAARSDDVLDMAVRATASHMRGFNIMGEHMENTGGYAYLVRKLYPNLEVFGGVSMNLIVGQNVNPWLIIHMAEMKGGYGRFVEMPTWDSEWSYHTVGNYQSTLAPLRLRYFKQPFVATAVCADGGAFWANYPTPCPNADLRPEVKQAIQIIATLKTRESNGDLILQTAHESPQEDKMQVIEAIKDGVKAIVISHPMLQTFTPEQVGALVNLAPGRVWAEFTSQFGGAGADPKEVQRYLDSMKAAGVEHFYISSDTGQAGSKYQPDALADCAALLRSDAGFSEHDLDLISP